MKSKIALFLAISASTIHSYATIGIEWEFDTLRNSLGTPLAENTAYVIVADTGGIGAIPGASDVTGLSLSIGSTVGQGTVFFAGLSSGGYVQNAVSSIDMADYGVVAGDKWSIFWFPGITSLSTPVLAGQSFGSFQSTTIEPGVAGFSTQAMTFPTDGFNVTTVYFDNTVINTDTGLPYTTSPTPAQFSATQTAAVVALSWDTNNAMAGAQGGAGTWDTSTSNWHVGSINTVWVASGTNNDAIFGGTSGIVNIPSPLTANDLTFNSTGYSITGSPLTLNGTTPTVTTSTAVNAQISSAIQGANGLVKAGNGNLTLSGSNSYTGTTSVNAGALVINGSTSAASPVNVQSGAVLAGTGTIGGNVTLQAGAAYSPGNLGAVGTQAISGDFNVQASSIFKWDLTEASTSTGFDQVTGSGGKNFTAAGQFQVISDLDFTVSTFWDTNKTWNNIFSGFGTNTGWTSSTTATVYDSLGNLRNNIELGGGFTITGSSLTWTAIPEVSNCLIGGLLGMGLLRRRRTENIKA